MLTVISSFLDALLSMGLKSAQSVYLIKYKKNGINDMEIGCEPNPFGLLESFDFAL